MTTFTRPPAPESARLTPSNIPSAPACSVRVCEATSTRTFAGAAVPTPPLAFARCPVMGAGATHTGSFAAFTGTVTGMVRWRATVEPPGAEVEVVPGLVRAAAVGALLAWVVADGTGVLTVRVRDSVLVPAAGHLGADAW
ncbi:hypothetical protein [Peterkaempfera sp. SMS 1(5)a]|uniref:hypothetical protein n=1 Tax=Peterkaempfera podocarpi TaxID=3232308 RepID=UPI00367348DE